MTDKQKAFAALHLALQTCSGVLKVLRETDTVIRPLENITDASLDTRLNDYTSLLSLLFHDTTKLAIALKPGSLTYSAAISPAKELAGHADGLASCAYSIQEAKYGRTLGCEVRWLAEDVLNGLESLLGVYSSDAHNLGVAGGTEAEEPYLVRTGVVHEAINRARSISRTNREAVRKRWEGLLGGLGDCENEVKEMVEDEEGSGDEGGNENEDDGWGDLGGEPLSRKGNVRASEQELSRLKTVAIMFKFSVALVKRVDVVILRPSSNITSPPPKTLDALLSNTEAMLKAADELVHALYIPQESGAVSDRSNAFIALVDGLRSEVSNTGLVTQLLDSQGDSDAITDLSQRTGRIKLETLSDGDEKVAKERKWFDTCFAQIFKAATRMA